jgi:hypothetical protein
MVEVVTDVEFQTFGYLLSFINYILFITHITIFFFLYEYIK